MSKIGEEEIVVGKEKGRRRDRKESGARAEIKDDDGGKTGMGAGVGEYRGWKKQRLGAKVASAGETSEYGDAGADIEKSRRRYRGLGRRGPLGGRRRYMQIFFQPPRKTEAPFPASLFLSLSSRAPPPRLSEPPFPFSPCSSLFCCSLSRAFHAVFSPALSLSLVRRVRKKKKKEERKEERERRRKSVIAAPFLYRAPPYSLPRARLPPFHPSSRRATFPGSRTGRRPDGFHRSVIHCALCILNAR